jgi:hypothetical protein
MGSAANMVRSLLVVLGIVAVVIAIVPRQTKVTQPPVDAASVVAYAVKDSGTAFDFPADLPSGWTATSARYGPSTDSRPTWQAGWATPDGGFVELLQTTDMTSAWLAMATNKGLDKGTVTAAGKSWAVKVDDRSQPSLVSTASDGVTTVVLGTGSVDSLRAFVEMLHPAAAAT